jgi:2-polyprenyl-6-methoxyphenol hydroxylase-like FAD-dependent oxidoreductase
MPFGWPIEEFRANRGDVEGNMFRAFDLVPEFAERVRNATRETKFVGTIDIPFYFRKPYGPGWALVGDAAYHKDPITAYGITDAFHGAERLADALDAVFSGRLGWNEALSAYQQTRDDEVMPSFELTHQFAHLEPPPPDLQQLLGAVHGNQDAMDDFISVLARTLPAPEFLAPENVERIFSASRPAVAV